MHVVYVEGVEPFVARFSVLRLPLYRRLRRTTYVEEE
jgi:hypothetical protein